MKITLLFIAAMLSVRAFSQVDSVEVNKRHYYEYVPGKEEPCKHDPSKYWLMHEIDFSYPELKSSDSKTDSVFNALVTKQVIYAHPYSHEHEVDLSQDSVNVHDNYCYEDTPFRTGLGYELKDLDMSFSVKGNLIKLALEYPGNWGSPHFVFCYITLNQSSILVC